jgi:hypothetical protein
MKEAVGEGVLEWWYLARLPTFEALRSDPGFQAIQGQLESTVAKQRAHAGEPPAGATQS